MSFDLYLVILFIVTGHYGIVLSTGKCSPKIVKYDVYDYSFINLNWKPPEKNGNSSLEKCLVKWKNSTDSHYKHSKLVSYKDIWAHQYPGRNYSSISITTLLSYNENKIKPCSSFDIEITAIFNDSSTTFTNITIETGIPKDPTLRSVVCISNSTNALEVKFVPPLHDYYSECQFQFKYIVRAEGYSQWNNDKEEIPKFETSREVILSGLSPNTEYHVYVQEKSSARIERCSATTLVEGPSPVILNKVFSTSPTTIFASWSPPTRPYEEITKYWIEATRTSDNLIKITEVQSKFTRAILQNLKPSCEYKIVIWAENEAGIGEKSEEITLYPNQKPRLLENCQ